MEKSGRIGIIVIWAISLAACEGQVGTDESPGQSTTAVSTYTPWSTKQAAMQQELDSYIANNQSTYNTFLRGTIVGGWLSGVPRYLWDSFCIQYPSIWGSCSEKMKSVGLGPDLFNPNNTLPFGVAQTGTLSPSVFFTCSACHVGKVMVNGTVKPIIGAPNTQFNNVLAAWVTTVNSSSWDLNHFLDPVAAIFKQQINGRRDLVNKTLGAYTDSTARVPNARSLWTRDWPGHVEAGLGVAPVLCKPEIDSTDPSVQQAVRVAVLNDYPAIVDLMSIWRQGARPRAEWDGSVKNRVYRNLIAQVNVSGGTDNINLQVSKDTAQFMMGLPVPPYPFAVDDTKAARGLVLFEEYCAGCHQGSRSGETGSELRYPAITTSAAYNYRPPTGTDPNRALGLKYEGRKRAIAAVRSVCTDTTVCTATDDDILLDSTVAGNQGYLALPLDGIWARAPYFHNGSVPTLYQLLVPSSRPATFWRGNINYDQTNVGFVWNTQVTYSWSYDTTRAGQSNRGHDTIEYLGEDWSSNPSDLADLLEYLKTL